MRILKQINESFENGLTKILFDHLRNILICALLLAIGTDQFQSQTKMLFGFAPSRFAGVGVIGISFILAGINIYDGIRMIYIAKWHKTLTLLLIFLYLFLTARILEMAWNFRITL